MKLSVVIPHHYGLNNVEEPLKRCISHLKGHHELIVIANDGIGYGAAVNMGMSYATGDHIFVCNNDTWLVEGTLRDLCLNVITVPKISPEPKDRMPRAAFCIPKWVYDRFLEVYGYFFDERFEIGYWEDDDLIYRIREQGLEARYIEHVHLFHQDGGGLSMKQMGEQHFYDENKKIFEEKWNK